MKICSKCNIEKDLSDFDKSSRNKKDGHYSKCKSCRKIQSRERYINNKEKILEQNAKWKKANPEKVKIYDKTSKGKPENKAKANQRAKEPKRKQYLQGYRKNSTRFKEYQEEYSKTPKRKKYARDRVRNKRKTDPNFHLEDLLRNNAKRFFRDEPKTGSGVSDLGASIDQLKERFFELFKFQPVHKDTGELMSWSTRGGKEGWVIDHIIPIDYFELRNREEFLIASNYKNLQPLWRYDNLEKSDKLPPNYKELYNEIRNDLIKAGKISPDSLFPLDTPPPTC